MKVEVRNMAGQQVDEVVFIGCNFGIEPNRTVMHQGLVRQLANPRQRTRKPLSRSEVRRTGGKIWRQKGTGRVRDIAALLFESTVK